MTKGFLYGLIYFLLVPFLVLTIAWAFGQELVFISYFTWSYGQDYWILLAYSIWLSITLAIICRKLTPPRYTDFDSPGEYGLSRQQTRLTSLIAVCWILVVEVLTFALMDHNVHWRERDEFSLFPHLVTFYARPVYDLIVVLVIARVARDVVVLMERSRTLSFSVLLVNSGTIALVIINSGNRWYLALLVAFIFLFASRRVRLVLLALFPVLAVFGAILSFLILSHRVAAADFNLETLFSAHYQIGNLSWLLLASIFQITEGGSATSLLQLLSMDFVRDPFYFFKKILLVPLPGSMIDKELPFNIIAGAMIEGTDEAQSINTTILGIFVYSFGYFGLIIAITLFAAVAILDSRVRSPIIRLAGFGVAFASVRFGLEYFVVHIAYLYGLHWIFRIRL